MKLGNINGRAVIVLPDGVTDVEQASGGRFGPDIQGVLRRWDEFTEWTAARVHHFVGVPVENPRYDAAVPEPGQVFAVGLNYRAHALEAGLPLPEVPLVFTKFPSSVAAPSGTLVLPTDQVDWEVEVAVVIGRAAHRVSRAVAWDHVAAITGAQDFSARDVQLAGGAKPQFSLGKSFSGFTPLGPLLVTPDEFPDRDAIALECRINGATVQASSTADLIFPVPAIVSYLSHIVTLRPGDVILTGTPSGVGLGMDPPRYLATGDQVTTTVELCGVMHHVCGSAVPAFDAAGILG
ncbi:MAG TPA: fumarylacetoacetate hydrolase family protein [Nocardioidaceae bacterium]|nr:fumarylacetoacetate hydrolase family protein [Nocardioidaceae bacterium]